MNWLTLTLSLLIGAPFLLAEDWPAWRGEKQDARWPTGKLPADALDQEPKLLWKMPVGKGFGGVTVMSGRVLLMDRATEPSEIERLLCLDAQSGKVLWEDKWPVTYGEMGGYSTGPRTSVLQAQIEGKHLAWALGATGNLRCYDVSKGSVVWAIDCVKKLGAVVPQWGFSGSPVLRDGRLHVHLGIKDGGGSVVAFEPLSGEVIWTGGFGKAGYCTPEFADGRLLQWGPDELEGLDPSTGSKLWSFPYEITYGVSIAQPLAVEGIVIVSGYWHGTRALHFPQDDLTPELLWQNEKDICGLMSSPLYKKGRVYLLDKTHGLTCFDLKTGKIYWQDENKLTPKDRNPHFSLVWLDESRDLIAVLNANGELVYAKLQADSAEELARHQIIGKTWAHPAFFGNRVIARSDREVVAWETWR
ncbi:MAG: PQQ-binding-like beta-propeller repeat protein [Verrucomicrobiaceae bacterium]|nr:PQQ-binding-like beta-propeller repeat protein [Verrucomicrobiaceae bacterium]